jgi:hypothetical protein
MGLAALSSSWFRSRFPHAPPEPSELIPFAWVGGSIWGVYVGALVSVVVGLVVMRATWNEHLRREAQKPTAF